MCTHRKLKVVDSHRKSIILEFPSSKSMKECMRKLGWDDVENVKGFIKYIMDEKLVKWCKIYLSRTTVSALERLTPEDLYILTFVDFAEIKGSKRNPERFSFKVYDLYPGDYYSEGSEIISVAPHKRSPKDVLLRRINARIKNKNKDKANKSVFGEWIVEIIGDKPKSKGVRKIRARKSPKVDPPLKKYIGYYLCPHLSKRTLEGKIIDHLYKELGISKIKD